MYKISLLENAVDELDSVRCELEAYIDWKKTENVDPRQIQYALKRVVKNISSCSELLIKYRLYEEHWAFIFQDVNKASVEKLGTGSFSSVRYEDAIERLKNLCSIKKSMETLSKLHQVRNRLEHFEVIIQFAELKKLIIGSIEELAEFCAYHILTIMKDDEAQEHTQKILGELSALKATFLRIAQP